MTSPPAACTRSAIVWIRGTTPVTFDAPVTHTMPIRPAWAARSSSRWSSSSVPSGAARTWSDPRPLAPRQVVRVVLEHGRDDHGVVGQDDGLGERVDRVGRVLAEDDGVAVGVRADEPSDHPAGAARRPRSCTGTCSPCPGGRWRSGAAGRSRRRARTAAPAWSPRCRGSRTGPIRPSSSGTCSSMPTTSQRSMLGGPTAVAVIGSTGGAAPASGRAATAGVMAGTVRPGREPTANEVPAPRDRARWSGRDVVGEQRQRRRSGSRPSSARAATQAPPAWRAPSTSPSDRRARTRRRWAGSDARSASSAWRAAVLAASARPAARSSSPARTAADR